MESATTLHDQVKCDLWRWINEFISVPNEFYKKKFAPCPYAKSAVLDGQVDVVVWESGSPRDFIRDQAMAMRDERPLTGVTTRCMGFPPRMLRAWGLVDYVDALNLELVADNVFLNAGVKQGPVTVKGFAYLLDYDESIVFANSSQTYGIRAVVALPLGKDVKWGLIGSYARQSDYGRNPTAFAADYALLEGTLDYAGFKATAGYELLGSDSGANVAFQTPLATAHRFNGWADKFLTTPATGLRDFYAGIGHGWPKLGNMGPLVATFTYHRFYSDRDKIFYGDEYNAQLTLKVSKRLSALLKYADYQRNGIASFAGDADTQKLWGQLDYAL